MISITLKAKLFRSTSVHAHDVVNCDGFLIEYSTPSLSTNCSDVFRNTWIKVGDPSGLSCEAFTFFRIQLRFMVDSTGSCHRSQNRDRMQWLFNLCKIPDVILSQTGEQWSKNGWTNAQYRCFRNDLMMLIDATQTALGTIASRRSILSTWWANVRWRSS